MLLVALLLPGTTAQAADCYVMNYEYNTPQNIGGAKFITKKYEKNGTYIYKILMKKNGRTQVLLKDVENGYLTNGKIIYYVKHTEKLSDWKWENTIYRYNIRTKKKERVISGINYTVRASNGRYLYYGQDNEADGVELHVLDMKTGKKRHIMDAVSNVHIAGNRVVISLLSGVPENLPIYSFTLKGTDKKTIAVGDLLKTKGTTVYYYRINLKTNLRRMYSCNALGGNKKALTGWIKRIPEKYWH